MDFAFLYKPIKLRVRVRPTPYGWVMVFLLFWIPLTALVTANNFLLIVFIMMVGVVGVSHRMGVRNVRSMDLTRRFPEEIYASTPFAVTYRLRTARKLWGSMAFTLGEKPPLEGTDRGVAVAGVPQGEAVGAQGLYTIASRGDHSISGVNVRSSFPFGLAEYSVVCGEPQQVVVFPRIEAVDHLIPHYLGLSGRGMEKIDPLGTIPYLFRDYVPGDPYKHIDWKKTAQTGALVTRVFSEEGAREVTIRLAGDASELAISRAASLVIHLAGKGIPVALQGPAMTVGPGRGKAFARKLLTILARWQHVPVPVSEVERSTGTTVEVSGSGEMTWEDDEPARDGFMKRTG